MIAKKKGTITVGREITQERKICLNEHSSSPRDPSSLLGGERRLKNSKINLKL